MDPLEKQLLKLSLLNNRPQSPRANSPASFNVKGPDVAKKVDCSKVAVIVSNLEANKGISENIAGHISPIYQGLGGTNLKKVGPVVPPKPPKKIINFPEVPQSSLVKQTCEPLYSQRLQYPEHVQTTYASNNSKTNPSWAERPPLLQRKQPIYAAQNSFGEKASKVTLDNPAILEQQLEALAYHKKQLEKKGLLQKTDQRKPFGNMSCVPKLSSTSLLGDVARSNDYSVYTNENIQLSNKDRSGLDGKAVATGDIYSNIKSGDLLDTKRIAKKDDNLNRDTHLNSNVYCNLHYKNDILDDLPPPPPPTGLSVVTMEPPEYLGGLNDTDDIPPPPSPVSSSYSELRRATEIFAENASGTTNHIKEPSNNYADTGNRTLKKPDNAENFQTYMNMNYNNDYTSYSPTLQSISQDSSDYYGYGSFSQGSSTYESIYEPINPRPPSQLSKYLMYTPYANDTQISENSGGVLNNSSNTSLSTLGIINSSGSNTLLYPYADNSNVKCLPKPITYNNQKEAEVEALTDFLVHSMDTVNDIENYGVCYKCNERVVGENSGCTAMDQIYHIACFTCSQCQINLQGKPFYALEGKPYCEYDYLQTLEKCSVCMKPILERILRATGKPYHPQCFTCVVCGNSLDGIPFTVDATNQNYCIEDFHKKFAPRCCVCKEPIMPEPGEEETVRVVALDRSFHFECYKCEDCGLLLSSEAEGRGCYPLDDHVLCKSCNAERVQMLTNRMTTDL